MKDFNIADVLLESLAPILIISVNCFIYFFMNYIAANPVHFYSLILSKTNLVNGNYLCILTSGFIHLNFSHLFLNMLGVFIFGRIVEKQFGFLKTLFIFFGAQMISLSLAMGAYFLLSNYDVQIIGASGGLMGLIGCAMLLDPFRITYETFLPIPVMLKGWMFIYADLRGFLSGEKDGISHITHLFGFFSIAILIYFLRKEERGLLKQGLSVNIFFLLMFMGFNWWINWR